jgi:hypothetical protein
VADCAVHYKAYYEKTPGTLLKATDTPVAIIDTLKEPRKLIFTVNRNLVQTTIIFFIEAYIPNISKTGIFKHQMSVTIDGKKRALVTALKPASF